VWKNVMSAGKTRQNPRRKRRLGKINEHFEADFKAVWPSAIVFQPPAKLPRRKHVRGFTLAEILIAIAIFALLVSIVMGSFSGVFSHTEELAIERSNNAMARSCLMRMATDLSNAYVEKPPFFKPPEAMQDPSFYRFVAIDGAGSAATDVRLQFASRAHVDLGADKRQGIAIIRYYLEAMDEGADPLWRLRRADWLADAGPLPEPANDPILCENIRALKMTYLDAEGEASDEWDSSSADNGYATPRAVRIRLELASPAGPTVYQTIVALPLWRPASGRV
jgi:general secretion pathway protein J